MKYIFDVFDASSWNNFIYRTPTYMYSGHNERISVVPGDVMVAYVMGNGLQRFTGLFQVAGSVTQFDSTSVAGLSVTDPYNARFKYLLPVLPIVLVADPMDGIRLHDLVGKGLLPSFASKDNPHAVASTATLHRNGNRLAEHEAAVIRASLMPSV